MATQSRRIAWADRVRVLAVLLVILIHTVSPLFYELAVTDGAFFVCVALDSIGHAAIPLFVMVSGMLLLDEKRDMPIRRVIRHYALPMVGLYFFWSFVYALANKVIEPVLLEHAPVNLAMGRDFLLAVIEGAYHLWYLPMLVGLYLLTPLLRSFVRESRLSLVRWFLLLALIFQLAFPALIRLVEMATGYSFAPTFDTFSLSLFTGYPVYYVAGWYLANHRPEKRWPVYAVGALSLLAMIGLTAVGSLAAGEGVKEWMEPLSLFCGLYGAALFSLFAWESRPTASSPLLARFSALTFGVFLVHVEIQSLFKAVFPYTAQPLLYIAVQFAAVTVLSFAAAWVLSKIPVLKRSVRG